MSRGAKTVSSVYFGGGGLGRTAQAQSGYLQFGEFETTETPPGTILFQNPNVVQVSRNPLLSNSQSNTVPVNVEPQLEEITDDDEDNWFDQQGVQQQGGFEDMEEPEVTNDSVPSTTPTYHTPILQPAKPTSNRPLDGEIKYKKIRLLGNGAFGSVYLAMNILSGELIAVKEIRVDDGVAPQTVRDVQREIHVMTELPVHPNCVRYVGTQRHSDHVAILMEHVSGGSVESLLRSCGRFHEATIRQYAFMTLIGLQHLHQHSIVHQDIKGANVLIDSNGVAKIADFGCCKDLSAVHMNSSRVAGSPLFMAPEVCRGSSADSRSDVWSFGCFLLEMAKEDHMPWSGFTKNMSLFAIIYAISSAQRPPEVPKHLSPVAQDFFRSCLQLDPAQRASIDELLTHPFFTEFELDDSVETLNFTNSHIHEEEEEDMGTQYQSFDHQMKVPHMRVREQASVHINPIRALIDSSLNEKTPIRPMMTNSHKAAQLNIKPLIEKHDPDEPTREEAQSTNVPFGSPVIFHSHGKGMVTGVHRKLALVEEVEEEGGKKGSQGMLAKFADRFKCLS